MGSRNVLALAGKDSRIAPHALLLSLSKELGNDTVVQIAQQHLLLEPERDLYLKVLQATMNPEDYATFLRSRLQDRPPRVQWHCAYQSVMSETGREQQAEREYEAMLAKDPRNQDLMYLAGRASLDVDKALSLCQQSIAGASPSPSGFYWLTCHYLSNGHFEEAAQYAEKVAESLLDDPTVVFYCRQALMAGQHDGKLLEMLHRQEQESVPLCIQAYADEAYICGIRGQQGKVHDTITRLRTHLADLNQKRMETELNRLNAQLEYAAGRPAESISILQKSPNRNDRLAIDLTRGDLAAAERDIQQVEPNSYLHAIVYLVAMAQQRPDTADRYFQSMVHLLSRGNYEDRAFAGALAGGISSGPQGSPSLEDDACREGRPSHDPRAARPGHPRVLLRSGPATQLRQAIPLSGPQAST